MVSQVLGMFNVVVGLMLVSSILLFGMGFGTWMVRLGRKDRDEGIDNMGKGLTVLFVLIVLLTIVQFFQKHTDAALYVIAFVFFIIIAAIVITIIRTPAKEEEH